MKQVELTFTDFCKSHMMYLKSVERFFPAYPRMRNNAAFKIKIRSHLHKRIKFNTVYYTGGHNDIKIEDVLCCLYSDANCYGASQTRKEFIEEMGYEYSAETREEGNKVFKSCKKTYHRMMKSFKLCEYEDLEFCHANS